MGEGGNDHVTAEKAVAGAEESRLMELGYKQELKRDLSMFSNFAFSFSIISALTGITTLYNTGLKFGGPVALTYGWFIAGFFTMFVGLSMAEICSAYPTSGGLYYWSARLSGKEWAPFASWLTGWFNIVGQWAGTASVDFSLAQLLGVIILLSTGGANGGGYQASKYVIIGFHGGILLTHAILNSLPISILVLMVLIPSVAPEKASLGFVFTHFNADNNVGIQNKMYIFVLGLLMSQYTLTGYDASANMTEETKDADKNGPRGIIMSIGISLIVGWGYLLGITVTVTNISYLLSSENDAGGYAVAEIFYLAFKHRYGSGVGGILCLAVIAVAVFFCGMALVTSNSRTTYAFSRDGGMPFSSLWLKVNRQDVPTNAIWLAVSVAFCMALTPGRVPGNGFRCHRRHLHCICTSNSVPVTLARKSFIPGPFSLGRYSILVGWVAVLWVATITVLFSLPVAYPVTKETLNYTPVAVGGVLLLAVSSWILSARQWFKGPTTYIAE
ncbi:Amino-acid permease BAT1-like protein [Nymphaea thermarum]|nr:Amino-acid permease BAT1-like protein [Nymphaea thermarum]